MFRRQARGLELLLVHPGGPFWARKDEGVWTIPKGEAAPDEELLERAQIEFQEELGIPAAGDWIPLGSVKQRAGKVVHAWAFEGDLPPEFELRSNRFEIEWPPRSARRASFPEVDRAAFFDVDTARQKINAAQAAFIDRLVDLIAAADRRGS